MNRLFAFFVLLGSISAPLSAQTCSDPVCIVGYDTLDLAQVITFETVPSSPGPGRSYDEIIDGDGVQFGERFVGQSRDVAGDYDRITGAAIAPLTPLAGAQHESLGVKRLFNNNVLLGYGPHQFPSRKAIGEGAISVVFDADQSAFGFKLIGGEEGDATISFMRRDGSKIMTMSLGPLGETKFGFLRGGGTADIAGFVIDNQDPEGIAIDDLIFNEDLKLGSFTLHPGPSFW